MTLLSRWFTYQGKQAPDNRDHYGIAERDDACLYIVVDGSTSSPRGGELAHALISIIVDEFENCREPVYQEALKSLVSKAHGMLKRDFPADAASYLIAVYSSAGHLHTLHAGDCRLGRVLRSEQIQWLTPVHTLATALGPIPETELASHPGRHQLTRCFRGRRLDQPEYHRYSLYADDMLVIATDGFWAGSSQSQQRTILLGEDLSCGGHRDDTSCLRLQRVKDAP